jgi:hypothetical protein
MIGIYKDYLIPLENNLRRNALRCEGNYNEKEKIELLGRVEKLTVEKNTLETAMKQVSDRYEIQML